MEGSFGRSAKNACVLAASWKPLKSWRDTWKWQEAEIFCDPKEPLLMESMWDDALAMIIRLPNCTT